MTFECARCPCHAQCIPSSAPEDLVVAVGVERRIDVDQVHALRRELLQLLDAVAAVDQPRVGRRRRRRVSAAAMKIMPMKEGVDQLSPGRGVIYFSRLISRASQSRISKIISMPIYQSMTIRNWNTTIKIRSLMEGRDTRMPGIAGEMPDALTSSG